MSLAIVLNVWTVAAIAQPPAPPDGPPAAPIQPDAAEPRSEHPATWRSVPSPLADAQAQAARRRLLGDWGASIGGQDIGLLLTAAGRFELTGPSGRRRGTFDATERQLVLIEESGQTAYDYTLTDGGLTLSGGDLSAPISMTRQGEVGNWAARLFDLPPGSWARKMLRILTGLLIALAAWVVIRLLKLVSRFVIQTDWGPLGYLYRTHKNRAMTIHNLALNVVKYVVYFTALGYILGEIGVNYTAYLASLSVIGLAVGFGSQGLVQDTVTGFFVILENQYDVGDMVEISGQIGVVQEIGLRMTRLRNYLGQMVVIPNRNIGVVGNFTRGAQQARVDVSIQPQSADRSAELLRTVASEVARQFEGVVLAEPRVSPPVALTGGRAFLRLDLSIWPGQHWILDAQLLPRIREAFARDKLAIPDDRIAVFYHVRNQRPLRRTPRTFRLLGLRRRDLPGQAPPAGPPEVPDRN